ncbi:hypothetical protein HanRHA438_Chr10g0475871 [Helianthus annuus]|nr:hypothetical protein HanHA89_Chr10g0403031 [Helianthus annuus]KAJ0698463.1 hypothetical protein HanLR1_Chr10g0380251 [Helianthus annuus]KAJ0881588.1 hypothetical protein HanRHA438_Chr10g0475871 [Helianthus annuus]
MEILKSKKIIESKYQHGHDTASKEIQPSPGKLLTVEKLQKHVSNHWITTGSGNPQFITVCFHTTSAFRVICLLVTMLHTYTIYMLIYYVLHDDYDSDYGWSMMVILVVQFIGVIIGTIAPLSRCFATLSFNVSTKIISSHFKVFNVECYRTSMLHDWKHASIGLPFHSRNLEVVIETLKRIIFNICIGFQNGVVMYPMLENFERSNDLRPYVFQLEDEIELGERTLKGLSKYVSKLIQKGAKSQPNNLMKLVLGKSTSGFQGVKNFDHIDDQGVPFVDSWMLPVVTLTTIAVSFPKIEKKEVDSLLESVREGLVYVAMVEQSFDATDDHVCFHKAADTLWQEIIYDRKWLGNELQDRAFQANTDEQIVEWFRNKAKNIICSEGINKDDTMKNMFNQVHPSARNGFGPVLFYLFVLVYYGSKQFMFMYMYLGWRPCLVGRTM